MPAPILSTLRRLALIIGLSCMGLMIWSATRQEAVAVRYQGKWRPMAPTVHPGESVYFRITRRFTLDGRGRLPILIYTSFQNAHTGTTYPCPPLPHVIRADSDATIIGARFLPADVQAGTYFLTGWAETRTARRPAVAEIESEEFEVLPPIRANP